MKTNPADWTAEEYTHHLESVVEECTADLAALRAQIAAAEVENARLNGFLHECHRGMDIQTETLDAALKGRWDEAALASARADAVREWADSLLNEGVYLDYGSNIGRESPTDAAARYLSSRGVPSARPDDGRVERVARWFLENGLDETQTYEEIARAIIAAADGAERGGR